MRKPTLRDVAQLAKVAPGTVSAILNKSPRDYSSAEVRERVSRVARELGYRPNRLAQSLRRQSTQTVAVMHKNRTIEILRWQMMGLAERASQLGYQLLVAYDRDMRQCVETLLDYRVDGVIWQTDAPESLELLEMLRATHVPVVTMHGSPLMEEVSSVDSDHVAGMRAAVKYLVGLGHRRVGVAFGGLATAFEARLAGVRSGLFEHGLSLSPADLHQVELGPNGSEDAFSGGNQLGKRFAQMKDRPTAMLMGNDELAMGFIRGFHDSGLRVPRDISIVGFDGIKAAPYWEVPLTTVAQARQQVGVMAMDLLVERIADPTAPPRHVMLPTELVIRASCGQAPV